MEMRAVFAEKLGKLMENDKNVMVLDADLAKATGTVNLRKQFPDRALDVGIAEQNMASIAAGLASYGFKPYITSFSPFVTRRICDQLTLSICYAGQNVKIVGTDPGIAAELNGGTHMGLEDIGVIRSIPGLVIYEPTDAAELASAMPAIDSYKGALYIRLFRKAAPDIFPEGVAFDLFKAPVIREGKDVSIFASGCVMVSEAKAAAELLAAEGISAEIAVVHTIKPIDTETVLKSVRKTGCAVSAENHNIIGGLGSAIAETLSEAFPAPLMRIGIKDRFGEVGKLDYLKEIMKMRAADIAEAAKKAIKAKK